MGENKRKRSDEDHAEAQRRANLAALPTQEQRDLAQLLKAAVPRTVLLEFRKNFAMGPLPDALEQLKSAGPFSHVAEAVAKVAGGAAMAPSPISLMPDEVTFDKMPAEAVEGCRRLIKPLQWALNGSECWAYAWAIGPLSGARASLRCLLDAGRSDLLAELQRGDPFFQTVRRHMGAKHGHPLTALHRPRAMWLLGAAADDPRTVEKQKHSKKQSEEPQAKRQKLNPTVNTAAATKDREVSDKKGSLDDESTDSQAKRQDLRSTVSNSPTANNDRDVSDDEGTSDDDSTDSEEPRKRKEVTDQGTRKGETATEKFLREFREKRKAKAKAEVVPIEVAGSVEGKDTQPSADVLMT